MQCPVGHICITDADLAAEDIHRGGAVWISRNGEAVTFSDHCARSDDHIANLPCDSLFDLKKNLHSDPYYDDMQWNLL